MTEEWRTIAEAPNYEASSYGYIRRAVAGKGGRCVVGGRIGSFHERRYWSVHLHAHGRNFTRRVHTIIATTFLGPRPSDKAVNHIDGNRNNNRLDNLEYVTPAENNRHAVRIGLNPPHPKKLTSEQVRAIEALARSGVKSRKQLRYEFGVSKSMIAQICRREVWKTVWTTNYSGPQGKE